MDSRFAAPSAIPLLSEAAVAAISLSVPQRPNSQSGHHQNDSSRVSGDANISTSLGTLTPERSMGTSQCIDSSDMRNGAHLDKECNTARSSENSRHDVGNPPPSKGTESILHTASKAEMHEANLFVSGLAPDIGDLDLYAIFRTCGPICSCEVVREPTSCRSRCVGFVQFVSIPDADSAIQQLNGAQVHRDSEGKESFTLRVRKASQEKSRNGLREESETNETNKIFVRHIPMYATTKRLAAYFSQFGAVTSCNIHRDISRKGIVEGTQMNMAYITFQHNDDAERTTRTEHINIPLGEGGEVFPGPLVVKLAETLARRNCRLGRGAHEAAALDSGMGSPAVPLVNQFPLHATTASATVPTYHSSLITPQPPPQPFYVPHPFPQQAFPTQPPQAMLSVQPSPFHATPQLQPQFPMMQYQTNFAPQSSALQQQFSAPHHQQLTFGLGLQDPNAAHSHPLIHQPQLLHHVPQVSSANLANSHFVSTNMPSSFTVANQQPALSHQLMFPQPQSQSHASAPQQLFWMSPAGQQVPQPPHHVYRVM